MRNCGTVALAAAGLFVAAPAAAQDKDPCPAGLVCASDTATVINALKAKYPDAKVQPSDTGNPKIELKNAAGLKYTVFFEDCDAAHVHCASFNFRAWFEVTPATDLAFVNAFNYRKRLIKASKTDKGDSIQLDYDLSTVGGITPTNFIDALAWWEAMLAQYSSFDPKKPGA